MKYTILIAEDDNDIVKLLKLYLESSGYRVLTVDNGLSAFELIQNEQIDLAVVDIMMPKMDGYELIKKTREVKNIPILILSAKNQDTDKILGLNLGADDYMTKPFSPLEIIARVKANLRRFYNLNNGDSIVHKNSEIVIGELILNTEKLTLTKMELRLLLLLMSTKFLHC